MFFNQHSIYKMSGREPRALSSTLTSLDSQQSALSDSLEKLNGAVQRLNTLPSQSFLPAFGDSYREAFELTLGCIGTDAGAAETEIEIRVCWAPSSRAPRGQVAAFEEGRDQSDQSWRDKLGLLLLSLPALLCEVEPAVARCTHHAAILYSARGDANSNSPFV